MPRQMSPQRRRVVALAGSIAAISGLVPTLTHGHPYVADAIMGVMVFGLIYVIREMLKLRRTGNCR